MKPILNPLLVLNDDDKPNSVQNFLSAIQKDVGKFDKIRKKAMGISPAQEKYFWRYNVLEIEQSEKWRRQKAEEEAARVERRNRHGELGEFSGPSSGAGADPLLEYRDPMTQSNLQYLEMMRKSLRLWTDADELAAMEVEEARNPHKNRENENQGWFSNEKRSGRIQPR